MTIPREPSRGHTPPPIAGLAEHWGLGVFTCPYCDGWEHQDLPLAVIGEPAMVPHLGGILTGWTDRVTVFADITDVAAIADLADRGVTIGRREITRVIGNGESVSAIEVAGGDRVEIGAVFVAALPTPNSGLARSLGCDLDPGGVILVDADQQTSVPGVWAAGDVTHPTRHQVSIAVSTGVIAASSCNRSSF